MNPPEAWPFLRKRMHLLRKGRRLIGIWFWEAEDVPLEWIEVSRFFDEVWVASHWSKRAFEQVLHCAVKVFPIPIDALGNPDGPKACFFSDAAINENRYVFLNVFDYRSSFERKNPLACIRAFKMAFPPNQQNAQLLIKTLNAAAEADKNRRLLAEASDREDIIIKDMDLSAQDMDALYRRADCFVSLHRSEGLGMGFLQSIASGKSAIITDYSAPSEFASLPGVYAVRHAMTKITGDIPSYTGCVGMWAEADISHAAEVMRLVARAGRTIPSYPRPLGLHTATSFVQFVKTNCL